MYADTIVPDSFEVPLRFETERLRLRPLDVSDVVKDFAAVVESETRLKTVYRPGSVWPTGLTLERNLADLGWHQTEFRLRSSFAYTVVTLDESRVEGCLYFYPTRKGTHDVEVLLWVREGPEADALDEHLFAAVERWVADVWPFENPAYPGRRISHADWAALPTR